MQGDQELVDFDVDPVTGKAHIVNVLNSSLASSFGLTQENSDRFLSMLVLRRAISPLRSDKDDILAAFGARSPVDIVLMGHGVSLTDQLWYRSPGSTEGWKDVNFHDNAWDPSFGEAVLTGDYAHLADASPNVPEVTTSGHAVKAWERNGEGIYLVKAAEYPDGAELAGAKLGAELCSLLFGEGHFIPLDVVERSGRPCSVSPLMLAPDEELANGNRLCAIVDAWESPVFAGGGMRAETCDALVDIYTAIGIEDASSHVARRACFACLALFSDFNVGNVGAIRKISTDVWRAAPIFDYDGAFGIPLDGTPLSYYCENPVLVNLFCAQRFSFLDPSWDWSWCDMRKLEGFEDAVKDAFASCQSLPPAFADLVSRVFVAQRDYVKEIVQG